MGMVRKQLILPDHQTMHNNIVRIYANASDFDMESGLHWYERTRAYCEHWALYFDIPLPNVVGAYAVISPSLNKETNDKQLIDMLIAHVGGLPFEWLKVGVYGMRNKMKAKRCLEGDLTAVGGDKVTRFYRNILGIGDDDVTVDRWALRVALNDPTIMDTQGMTKKQYEHVHAAYVAASETLGVKPLQCQAVTWEVLRNKYFRKSNDLSYKPALKGA